MKGADFPLLLTGARLALAPLLGLLAWRGRGTPFCACLLAELGLDIADGMLARQFSPPVALARQRRWDGRVDAVIYCTAPWYIWRLRPGVVRAQAGPLAALAGAHLLNLATGLLKFGRLPRYHTRSFKLSAGALGLAVPTLFTSGVGSQPFRLALLAATLAHLENIAITLTLTECRASVPTLWHALRGAAPPAGRSSTFRVFADDTHVHLTPSSASASPSAGGQRRGRVRDYRARAPIRGMPLDNTPATIRSEMCQSGREEG